MRFRIGVNLGDVSEQDGALYGDGVNLAAGVPPTRSWRLSKGLPSPCCPFQNLSGKPDEQ